MAISLLQETLGGLLLEVITLREALARSEKSITSLAAEVASLRRNGPCSPASPAEATDPCTPVVRSGSDG